MRYVYEHQEAARQKGLQASDEIRTKWTWANAADKIIKRLDDIDY